MIILNGYYHFSPTTEELRGPKAVAGYRRFGAQREKDSWSAKVHIPGLRLKMAGAVGVYADKFGFGYILNFEHKSSTLSFVVEREHNPNTMSLLFEDKRGGEYWGAATDLVGSKSITASCLLSEHESMTMPGLGIPPSLLN